MFEIKGSCNTAKIYTDSVDNSTYSQIQTLCNSEAFRDSQIRIMPDCHAGIGCVIGTTMTLVDKVTPNIVGIDIGCGMLAIKLKEKRINLPEFDSVIRTYIGSGRDKAKVKTVSFNDELSDLRCLKVKKNQPIRLQYAHDSLGTLGGGNHFIELDRDSEDNIWLVIHTGSRHLGIEVCNWYQNQAWLNLKFKANNGNKATHQEALIAELKSQGRFSDIEKEIKKFDKTYMEVDPSIPFEFAYCEGSLMDDYIHDMAITQRHAFKNRHTIAEIILKRAKLHQVDSIESVHNYIDTDKMILRKGAVSAKDGELLVIPINMRDGTLICRGKGNPDWNFSAPHGAGRLFSRSAAKQSFTVSEFKRTMKEHNVFSTSINSSTLNECPMAYKPIESITSNIADTVDIIDAIKPIYNFKAGTEDD